MYGYKFLHVDALDGYLLLDTPKDIFGILALVKLEIPDDAIIVYPVNKDYYCSIDFSECFSYNDFYEMNDYVKAKKCRCSKAKIVEVIKYYSIVQSGPSSYFYDYLYEATCNLEPSDLIFKSMYNPNFIYKFNEYVEPDKIDEDILLECSNGIHFCRTTEDATDYIEMCDYVIMDKEE